MVDPTYSCSIDLPPLTTKNMWDPLVEVVDDHILACYIDYDQYVVKDSASTSCWMNQLGESRSWISFDPPPETLYLSVSAVNKDKLLVIGGSRVFKHNVEDMSGSAIVQKYDMMTRRWSRGPSLPAPLFEGCAVGTNIGVVVIGDFESGSYNTYILKGSEWKPLPLSTYAHTNPGCGLVTLNNKAGVLVISGVFVEFLDLSDRKWVKLPHTIVSRKRDIKPTVGMTWGHVVISGGVDMDSGEVSDAIEVWDEEKGRWRVTRRRVTGKRIRQGQIMVPSHYAYDCHKEDLFE